ncbi:N-acetylmuramoyl-L-alanine amidase [Granulicella arctica]|uniref:N-acetylmuramoyl-L-alanine amidase n=1 Tax=Granulicella arctica TaxID=940613 RepID=A0A7Y9TFB0_9BACT|nr:N-acetylmuramoyl-L-alanine amidase [Granulicella arctica]
MQSFFPIRVLRWASCALLLTSCVPVFAATKTQRRPKLTPWEEAEHGRETLEAIPAEARTKADYDRALDGFRAIYHENPGDVHAPAGVFAVAEILAEEGRGLHDAKRLTAAVGQYEFLRTQYPACSLRVQALLAEAQIEQNDLQDAKAAKERYRLLLKQSPKSDEAEEARAALAEMSRPAASDAERRMRPEMATVDAAPPVNSNAVAAQPLQTAQDGDAALTPVSRAVAPRQGPLALVSGIRHWSTPNYTRVVIDLGDNVTYEAARVPNPDRIYFDLHGTRLAQELVGKSFAVTDDGFLKKIRAAQFRDEMTRVVLDVNDVTEYSAFLLPNPYRLIIDIHGQTTQAGGRPAMALLPAEATVMKPGGEVKAAAPVSATPVPNTTATKSKSSLEVASLSDQPGRVEATRRPTSKPISAVVPTVADQGVAGDTQAAVTTADSATTPALTKKTRKGKSSSATEAAVPARAAVPTADGQTSLVRALGLKIGRIVIDAGHGGHDSGTLGVDGIEEKDVVLDVALRLGKMLHDRLGAEIIYTRSDDTFIPLETRTAIANKAQADLFLSIHANSSPDADARGVETYYLNFTSEPDALQVAARENAVSDQSIHQLSDLVKKITLKDKIDESREFAGDVEQGLYSGLHAGNAGLKNRGVKKAPFVVLIGANMPSVLAEISFVTNPRDASQLKQPEYRQRVAESLYTGVAKYESGLSGVHVPVERASGQ